MEETEEEVQEEVQLIRADGESLVSLWVLLLFLN